MNEFLVWTGTILFVIFFFGFCIFIHELGHFLVARWRGLHIIAFSIGFKKAWAFKRGGIEYRIGWLPFGGYVDLPQIDATGEATDENGNALPPAKPLDRMLTAFAGPFFNVLFGFALGTIIWLHGIPQSTPKMHSIIVAEVDNESPEYRAGLRKGDEIIAINGHSFYSTWKEIIEKILYTIGDVELTVRRNGETVKVKYIPEENSKILPEERVAIPYFKPKIPAVLYPEKGSPAAAAGVKSGDKVLKVNGEELIDFISLMGLVDKGKPMFLTVLRDGEEFEIPNPVKPEIKDKKLLLGVNFEYDNGIIIKNVVKGSGAAAAGLKVDDLILKVDGQDLPNSDAFASLVANSNGKILNLDIKRGDELLTVAATPKFKNYYSIGVKLAFFNHPTPWRLFVSVAEMNYKSVRGIVWRMINKNKSSLKLTNLSGPLRIVHIIGIAVHRGSYIQGFYIIAVISFSLAMLNLLPLPVLDGGHIVFALIEMVARRPLPAKLVYPITVVFVVLLISLMIFVTVNDVMKMIGVGVPAPTKKTAPTPVSKTLEAVKDNAPKKSP